MQDKKERWLELCALAAEEQDPQKLMELVSEINRLLEQKERRLGSSLLLTNDSYDAVTGPLEASVFLDLV
jgi:hypothetical protein